ncbi:hypothetical protein [Prauserella marina]|uniref:hypothetical protein n=1 Tax=Prauserella marina TaxID=530584 RepID=UPI00115FAB9C|nr:hypothetical protein [Prauserella marina]
MAEGAPHEPEPELRTLAGHSRHDARGVVMELFRVLAIAAVPLGIIAAITMSDAWWFFSGLIAFMLLMLSTEPQSNSKQ